MSYPANCVKIPPMRIVIKVGTSSISNRKSNSINFLMIETLAGTISGLMEKGHEIILVTSGAVGYGVVKMGETNPKYADKDYSPSLEEKLFLSSVGQPMLMKCYIDCFAHYNKPVAQILISDADDFTDKYAAKTILRTLENNVIPVVNENDSVNDAELRSLDNNGFGDNDTLSAYVAKYVQADRLFLVTDVDGFYTTDNGKLGALVPFIRTDKIDDYMQYAGGAHTQVSIGGMKTKLIAAKIASSAGCMTHIIKNTEVTNIGKVLDGEQIGTRVG